MVRLSAHRFAAYCFYGSRVFEDGIQVRVVDGNAANLAKSNIVLATKKEIEQAKPKEVRIRTAKRARAKQLKRPPNAKLSYEDAVEIRKLSKTGVAMRIIAEHFGVSPSAIWKIVTGKSYSCNQLHPLGDGHGEDLGTC